MRQLQLLTVVFTLLLGDVHSGWWWPTRTEETPRQGEFEGERVHSSGMARFEVETVGLPGKERGAQLLEELRSKLQTSSCFHSAYVSLYNSCREVLRDEETKMRLAYRFADCFLRSSGKQPLKPCSEKAHVKDCTKPLTDHHHQVLLRFYMDLASICHHLQSEAFKLETEQVVSDLKGSAHWVEGKLRTMQTQAEDIYESGEKVVESQHRVHEELQSFEEDLGAMHEDMNQGMQHLKSYADRAGEYMHRVSSLQKDIAEQQEKMASQQQVLAGQLQEEVSSLTSKAESLNTNVVKSLGEQEEFLAGQDAAMSSLTDLKKLQDDILRESTSLHKAHASLAKESQTILHALEVFSTKQALIFSSLDRLFSLHSAILVESRVLKAFLFYVPVAVLIYVLTGTKQTNNARALLYFGLCVSFGAEFLSLQYFKLNLYQSELVMSSLYVRGFYAVIALGYILYSILTFKDYSCLSYQMLLDMRKRIDETMSIEEPLYSYTESEGSISSMLTGPAFKNYEDKQETIIGDEIDDPDYDPSVDSDYEDLQVAPVLHDYNLRSSVRRRGRPLPPSAKLLDWETEEMFTSMFRIALVKSTTPSR